MKGSSSQIKNLSLVGAIVALGIIFGDIGTSPLYVFRAILASIGDVTADTIIGALSCIVWTLTLQTTVKYVFITLKADNRYYIESFSKHGEQVALIRSDYEEETSALLSTLLA